MLKKIYFLGLVLLASILLNAEEPAFFSNATNNSGRFEIIQSPLEKKYTFKLDKKTGETWHLQGNIKSIHWHKMPTISDDINYEELKTITIRGNNTIELPIYHHLKEEEIKMYLEAEK